MAAQFAFWTCLAAAAVIFAVMLWSVATFKTRDGGRLGKRGAASYLHSRWVEILWALVPIAIFASAVLPAQRQFAKKVDLATPSYDAGQLATMRR